MHGILIFGDSIVAGRGVTKNKSWVSLLANFFDKKNVFDTMVYNLGVPGESTTELLKRFDPECKARTKRHTPSDHISIIIAIGINDSKGFGSPRKYNTPLKVFSENIRKLITIAGKYSDNIIFVGLTPVNGHKTMPLDKNYFSNKNIKFFNSTIEKICKDNGATFIEILKGWLKKDYRKHLSKDKIHLNELGHKKIFNKIRIILKNPSIDLFLALKNEYSLSEHDTEIIKSRFIATDIIKSKLFIGQFYKEKPDAVFGGICIRKDTEEISLNTFYQIFMPLKIASILEVPCKIILPVQEEIILRPIFAKRYHLLVKKLEKGIKRIANDLNTEVQIINTCIPRYDKFLKECIERLNYQLTEKDSRYLYNLSSIKTKKPQNSGLRIYVNKRVLSGHSLCFMKKISKSNKFMIVEDVEQYNCVLYIKNFEKNKMANCLSFLPLPGISGSRCMFKEEKEKRLLLLQNRSYYESIWIKSPDWVLRIYHELFKLVNHRSRTSYKNFEWTYKTIRKISKYFE
ncbi:MAG: GDSL-type esterase/lipase family protein [bacterium]